MRICVVGTGYVGLVTGACLAETGNDVVCVDKDADKICRLRAGEVPIYEPGLEPLLQRNTATGRIVFSTDIAEAIGRTQVGFVAVGTPARADGGADLQAVDAVAAEVAQHAKREFVLVLKSTVPVGTNTRVRKLVASANQRIHVISNPEFLKEGDAVNDFLRPDRIVVGCANEDAFGREVMARLYHPVCLDRDRIVWMDPASAELTKYVANTMLAMRISFMNEIAMLCEKVGADVHQVRYGVGSDDRIGPKFLYAGPGYGGSCFPKDVLALVQTGHEHGVSLDLARTTHAVNERQQRVLFEKLQRHFEGALRGKKIAVWGIAFKPRTDDIREAPAVALIDALLAAGASVCAHDPEALAQARARFGDRVTLVSNAYDAAHGADALVLATEWRQYQNPDFERLRGLLRRPLLLDGRNIWSSYGLRAQGFIYDGIGVLGS